MFSVWPPEVEKKKAQIGVPPYLGTTPAVAVTALVEFAASPSAPPYIWSAVVQCTS